MKEMDKREKQLTESVLDEQYAIIDSFQGTAVNEAYYQGLKYGLNLAGYDFVLDENGHHTVFAMSTR
jgi:hypothetical protein